jgi:DNA-binding transcriptional regulator/RsmH inhibitor MraZ
MHPFTGIRDHRIDGKDRLVIPSRHAQAIQAGSGGRLYLVPSPRFPMVEAYPSTRFHETAAAQVPSRFEGDETAHRLFYSTAEEVELKGPGRITLPQRLLRYFPQRVVRIAGMNDHLELWDPETWEKEIERATGGFPLPGDPAPGDEAGE